MLRRYLDPYILEDLSEKMVFLSGPRQVGKTTLAQNLGKEYFPEHYEYLNWDYAQDRQALLESRWQADKHFFILDEIHKYRYWKRWLKGEYDKHRSDFHFLVTGSARLDVYRKSGDSLLGRYRNYRLHPLSVTELLNPLLSELVVQKPLLFLKPASSEFEALLHFGGFPEVFLKQSEKDLRRWQMERTERLVKEDIRDIESIRDLSALQILTALVAEKAGGLFSLNSIKEDLQVAHKTAASWVDVLERFYYHFRLYPYAARTINSLRKEPKIYLWDWSSVKDEGARLENMVASHLLKYCHWLIDAYGYAANLHYLRDKEQREVDFIVTIDKKPWFCVEVKSIYKEIPSALKYFARRLEIPYCYLVVAESGMDSMKENVRIISADKFLTALV